MKDSQVCLVVAHDAGGAEILASYVRQNKLECRFVLEGPAIAVFQRKLGTVALCSLTQGLLDATWCLCGTSWQSDIEWQAIEIVKAKKIRVVSFIDHWVNYPERFIRAGIQHLPDEIWVGDVYAERIAKEHFSNTLINLVDNPYFIDIKQEIDIFNGTLIVKKTNEKSILFVSENISGHALLKQGDINYFGYTEFDAIKLLLKNLDQVGDTIKTVVIRPHPSDKSDKYASFLKRYPELVKISDEPSLVLDIIHADVVVGCESMALVVALAAKRTVYSSLPSHRQCRLPHKEIIRIKQAN
jgi:hypothetical protein